MALSKLNYELDSESIITRINKVHGPPLPTLLDKDEIIHKCCIIQEKAQSIELINHMLGGPNMEYNFIEPEESFEAFDYLHGKMIQNITENKLNIMFFEDRKNVSFNVIVVVVQKPRKHGSRQHIVLKALVRMTIMLVPKVGFCRYFDLTGLSCFVIFYQLNLIFSLEISHRG